MQPSSIIIVDAERVAAKRAALVAGGLNSLQVTSPAMGVHMRSAGVESFPAHCIATDHHTVHPLQQINHPAQPHATATT